MSWAPNDHWRDTYDAWKLRSPDDDYYFCRDCGYFQPQEHHDFCHACNGVGWLEFHDGLVIPCTECSEEIDECDDFVLEYPQ